MKYGFIGCGNMAGAIVKGCIAAKSVKPDEILIFDVDRELQDYRVNSLRVTGCDNLEALTMDSECIFLGVKPNILSGLLPQLSDHLIGTQKLIVSMAAGYSLENIEKMLGIPGIPTIRIMPNIGAEVGASVTAICRNDYVDCEQYEQVLNLLNSIGITMEIDEHEFGTFSAIASCSPAFTFLYIDSLAKAAQKLGMDKKKACAIVAQAVIGSARLLQSTGTHPWELIDSVCSPGGTTIEGICTLESHQFQTAIVRAVEAAVSKNNSLTRKPAE